LDGNTTRTLAALREAARQGARLAITPECVLQGYPGMASDEQRVSLRAMAEPLSGARLGAIREIARETGMDIVVGFAEARKEGGLSNSCAYISAGGGIAAVYRKVHCRPFESVEQDGLYTPGTEFQVVSTVLEACRYTVGMYICFDREIPESTRCLRAMGAELIACPLATNTSRLDAPLTRADNEMLTRARAAENELFIAVVNHAGIYNGGSFVVGPSGECLLQMDDKSGVAVGDLPLGIVREKFHSDPLGWAGWGYRRPTVYDQYLVEGKGSKHTRSRRKAPVI
jgi:N-carbamoylputrescine amidase